MKHGENRRLPALPAVLAAAFVLACACGQPVADVKPTEFTVMYDANGATSGSVPTDATKYEKDSSVTVKANSGTLAKTGFAFDGWNTKADGSGITRQPGTSFSMPDSDVKLYAKWKATTTPGTGDTPTTPPAVFTENMSLPVAVRDYYRSAYGKSGAELKAELQKIIKNSHTAKSYNALWTMYYTSDNLPGSKVWDMYSSTSADGSTAAYWYTLGTDQAGNFSAEGQKYNREHTWPKSTFGKDENSIPGSDGHHVTPTDGKVNGQRSDHPYGEVGIASWTSQNGSKLGNARDGLGFTGTVFEPVSFYKGDHARMHFYMALRYYNDPLFTTCDWSNAGAKLKPWYDTMLDSWGHADPVSAKEIARNNAVQVHQGNRNPFIDYPELEDLIDLTD